MCKFKFKVQKKINFGVLRKNFQSEDIFLSCDFFKFFLKFQLKLNAHLIFDAMQVDLMKKSHNRSLNCITLVLIIEKIYSSTVKMYEKKFFFVRLFHKKFLIEKKKLIFIPILITSDTDSSSDSDESVAGG